MLVNERQGSAPARADKPPVQVRDGERFGPTPNHGDIPVALGRLTAQGALVFIQSCPYCRRPHWHGAQGITDGANRHRVPHCAEPTPAAARGHFAGAVP